MIGSLLFRADAGFAMGTGHVMRCLALAQAARLRGWDCAFASYDLPSGLADKLAAESIPCHPLASASELPSHLADVIVVDGYHFDSAYRAALRGLDCPVLCFDDNAYVPAYHADLLVNPNFHAAALPYDRDDTIGRCLLGPAYFPLRDDLSNAARPAPVGKRLLVTLGGSDPGGFTRPCVAALAAVLPPDWRIDVLVGPAVADPAGLRAALSDLGSRIRVHQDPPDLPAIMASAALAVSGGGGTLLELAALGVPTLVAITADNQVAAAKASRLPVFDSRQPSADRAIARRAGALVQEGPVSASLRNLILKQVDKAGAARIIEALSSLAAGSAGAISSAE